jgi:DNA-directed RNA polymerase specialized sigma24 family protein
MEGDSGKSGEPHSEEEVRRFFTDLTPGQRDRAVRFAKQRAFNGHVDADDLIHEAYVRMVGGARTCVRGADLFRVLLNTIRSLSSDRMFMTENARIAKLTAKGVHLSTVQAVDVADVLAAPLGENDEDGMDDVLHAAIMAAIDDDAPLLDLAEAVREGYRGHDLEVLLDVDTKGLAALRTRFRRKALAIRERVARSPA